MRFGFRFSRWLREQSAWRGVPSSHIFKRIAAQVKLKDLEGFGFKEANQRFRNLETCLAGCFSSGEELWQNQCSGAVVFVFVGWSSESFRLFTTLFFRVGWVVFWRLWPTVKVL